MSVILSIDPGERHTGVALFSDKLGVVPLDTIHHRDLYELCSRIRELIDQYSPAQVVIGDMGKTGNQGIHTSLITCIKDRQIDIECKLVGERLSSRQASKELYDAHSGNTKKDHSQSAVLILKEFLEVLGIS
jgi:putative transcription antitermination factor YqgF